jgi:hypothetical protein
MDTRPVVFVALRLNRFRTTKSALHSSLASDKQRRAAEHERHYEASEGGAGGLVGAHVEHGYPEGGDEGEHEDHAGVADRPKGEEDKPDYSDEQRQHQVGV